MKDLSYSIVVGFVAFWTLSLSGLSAGQELKDIPPCDHPIFCDGPVLEAVQLAELYEDSKTFVDMTLKESSDTVLDAFADIDDPTDKAAIEEFVATYFEGPDLEFDDYEPTDWKENPLFLEKIEDATYRKWAEDLHRLWFTLGRKIKQDVKDDTDLYSLIYVDEYFVVPGGRFREFFYWDTYWIIKGLLLSEMYDTVRGMLRNWAALIDRYGKILNGNRVYFENRSQPPFFIPTVYEFYKATEDRAFLAEMMPFMEAEYTFWMNERTVEIYDESKQTNHTLNQYNVRMGKPRPESFREDRETTQDLSEDEAAVVYAEIASACESGWDFSSRWLGPEEDAPLSSMRTTKIVPADLNSIMCLSERAMVTLHNVMGNFDKVLEYSNAVKARISAVESVLWSEDAGTWLDFDLETGEGNNKFSVANIFPLWARCFVEDENGGVTNFETKVLEYLLNSEVLDYPGGIPSTLVDSGQQWDYPNVWPPLMEVAIQAIHSINSDEAKTIAYNLAANWTSSNWEKYDETNVMYEKYNCNDGTPGSGGEYIVQDGFGWTNGVILVLLDKYGDTLESTGDGSRLLTLSPIVLLGFCMCSRLIGSGRF